METIQLIRTIQKNDILEISRYVRQEEFKVLINTPYKEDKLTPIWYMKKDNKNFDENIFNLLVENEAILDFKNKDEQTLLMYCIERGYTNMAFCLLKNDCDIDSQDKCGMTALHYAVYNLDVDMVESLLHCEINYRLRDNTGSTALDYLKNNLYHQHIDNSIKKKRKCLELLSF